MAARNIGLGWEVPAYGTDCDFFQGEAITLTFTRAAATTISTWTIVGYLRKFHGDADPVLTISGTITSASDGVFTLALTSAQTEDLVNQSYLMQVWRTDALSETLMSIVTVTVQEGTRT